MTVDTKMITGNSFEEIMAQLSPVEKLVATHNAVNMTGAVLANSGERMADLFLLRSRRPGLSPRGAKLLVAAALDLIELLSDDLEMQIGAAE